MQSSFRNGLRIQLRVTHALILRELLTRYGRHNVGFLWIFLEPMIFTLAVVTLWTAAGMHHGSAIPVVAFGITGYSTIMLWRNMPARTIGAIAPNLALLTHRPVHVFDVFFARIVLEGVGATTSFVALAVAATALGLMPMPEDLLKVLGGWLLLAWFGGALALLVGAWSEKNHMVYKVWTPFSYIMFPLSGAAFLVDYLPASFQAVGLYLPMVHCVALLRAGYFGSLFKAHFSVGYVLAFNAALTLLGLAQVRDLSRREVSQ
jgi:ABC-2 type transport system permease protein/capsular polysaccharide transport system permease protein